MSKYIGRTISGFVVEKRIKSSNFRFILRCKTCWTVRQYHLNRAVKHIRCYACKPILTNDELRRRASIKMRIRQRARRAARRAANTEEIKRRFGISVRPIVATRLIHSPYQTREELIAALNDGLSYCKGIGDAYLLEIEEALKKGGN